MTTARKVEIAALLLAGLCVAGWKDALILTTGLGGPEIIVVPLWIPGCAFLIVAVLAHRRARRPKPGTCPKCEYDLTGNVTGVCPECGKALQELNYAKEAN